MKLTTLKRIRQPSLAKKRLRRPRPAARKRYYRFTEGPVRGLWLSAPGTLVFKMGEWRGYYDGKNRWIAL